MAAQIKEKNEVSMNNFNAKACYKSGKGTSHEESYGTEHQNMGKASAQMLSLKYQDVAHFKG